MVFVRVGVAVFLPSFFVGPTPHTRAKAPFRGEVKLWAWQNAPSAASGRHRTLPKSTWQFAGVNALFI